MSELFIGLMSGTSVDAIDAALLDTSGDTFRIDDVLSVPYPDGMRARILALASAPAASLDELGQLDGALGQLFGQAANRLIDAAGVRRQDIGAIGSHGQTIRHRPGGTQPFTLQIGDPNQIAQATGITTVADFRRRDMALGGQGAPLVPAFHQAAFGVAGEARSVVNIGGIANLTVLAADGRVHGFDTGPGNVLLDQWIAKSRGLPLDQDGHWADSGTVDDALLGSLLNDPYFCAPVPKSTGPEFFNLAWLEAHMQAAPAARRDMDVQATLAELTAASIALAVQAEAPDARLVLVCGGGSHNSDLLARLVRKLPGRQVSDTSLLGVDPDFVEAAAFAWLARETLAGRPGNVPAATGARSAAVLGGIYPA